MTPQFIDEAIQKAIEGKSNLTEDVLKIRGFSTPTIRHLFNNLCDIDGTYLEVGLFCGASFCASLNKHCASIGVEDHSQDFSAGFDQVKQELKDNFIKFSDRAKEAQIHYVDCFAMDKTLLPDNIDIYYYDGWHDETKQHKAIVDFFDKMADKFILVVDDTSWDIVSRGTDAALIELKDKIEIERVWTLRGYHLQNDPVWHNGVNIYLIKKK